MKNKIFLIFFPISITDSQIKDKDTYKMIDFFLKDLIFELAFFHLKIENFYLNHIDMENIFIVD